MTITIYQNQILLNKKWIFKNKTVNLETKKDTDRSCNSLIAKTTVSLYLKYRAN